MWLTVHHPLIGEFSSVEGMGEGEDEEQLSSVVLYEDINGYLFSLRSKEARLSLVYQFIDFFGAHISPMDFQQQFVVE